MTSPASLTPKGAATRARIVVAAADLVRERGVGGTTLDDIRSGTSTSKSQLFHYFPSGKTELVAAIAAFQAERVLQAQRPFLDHLVTWQAVGGVGEGPARSCAIPGRSRTGDARSGRWLTRCSPRTPGSARQSRPTSRNGAA